MKKSILLLFAALLPLVASAHDFEVGGIYYITSESDKTAEVTFKGDYSGDYYNEYSGSITIPATVTHNGVAYSVTSIGISAFSGCSSLTAITIPESVTSIRDNAFGGCSSLTAITIPENSKLTSIGISAFEDCTSLKSITIPEGVTSIVDYAFRNCSGLTAINIPTGVTSIGDWAFYYCSSLTAITLPEGVTSIGIYAFYNCSSLTSINIPEGVTSIGSSAFYNCSSLTSINIPEGVTSIVDSAFRNCSGLTAITIPEGVTSIGSYAFQYCSNLTAITIPEGVTSIGSYAFSGCSKLTVITIPEGVTSIGSGAFRNCSGFTAIFCEAVIPPTVSWFAFDGVDKSIPVYVPAGSVEAYQSAEYWSEFTNIQPIPSTDIASGTCGDNLTWRLTEEGELVIKGTGEMYDYESYVDQPWYEYSGSIQSVSISEGVTSIGRAAFSRCSNLASIIIPKDVTSIGNYAFDYCSSLTAITIPANVTSIEDRAFQGCSSLTAINIPEGVTSIGYATFYECSSLTAINIPEGVASIGDAAFYECSSLTAINIPEGVTSIGDKAFQFCSSLISLTIPMSTTSIGEAAFSCCSSLTSIIVTEGNTIYDSREGCNAIIETSSNTLVFGCSTTIIPESVTSIGGAAFSRCSNLASITIPKDVTSIGNYAFDYCSSLTSITCEATTPPTVGGSYTFSDVDKSIPVYVPAGSVEAYKAAAYWSEFTNYQPLSSDIASGTCGDNLTWRLTEEYELIIEGTGEMYNGSSWEGYEEVVKSITIREGVTSIGDICFWDFSNLKVLTIPGSLTMIGGNPFYGCTELYTILLQSENPVYDTYDGNVVEKNSGTVVIGCRHVPAYSSVTKVGDFAYCGRGLSSIVIPESITSIGYAAFSENEDMTSITIPESVTSIGDHAFANCQKLTSVNIPEGVTKIGDWTFLQCYSLTSIEIPSSVTELGNLAFGLCESVTSITCKATNPPAAGNSFQGIDKSIPVYVPAGSVAAYKVANDWSEFTNILPIGEPEPATVTITINQYGSGTFSSGYALDFSEVQGLKAYAAAGYDTETGVVTLLRVNTAKAGIGLFVKGTPGETYEVPIIESTSSNVLNMLVATSEQVSVGARSSDGRYANYKYTILQGTSEPLFYCFEDGFSLGAGKAYLQIPVEWLPAKEEKARSIRLRFDNGDGTYDDEGTTSIDNSQLTIDNAEIIYDLMGRRVTSPQKGGLYIVDGKKVIY